MNNNIDLNFLIAQNEGLKKQNKELQKENQITPTLKKEIENEMKQLNVIHKAIDKYGIALQKIIAVEEMSELIKEISKDIRGFENRDQIIEEIADVEIVIQELSLIYNCTFEVLAMRRKKIERLKTRLENAEINE